MRNLSRRQQERQWSDSRSDSVATAVQFRIVCTLSGPDMKYSLLSVLSIWADSQFVFWTTLDSVQMAYPMRILEKDKAIEVRSEILCTG